MSKQPDGATPHSIYMGALVTLTTLANGAVTNANAYEKLQKTSYVAPEIDTVVPGVTVFGGDGFLNLTLIEGRDGLIVYDTGEYLGDGERFLKQIRSISDKPIAAVLYSHSHYVQGTTALIGDGKNIPIVGHPGVNANVAGGAAGCLYSETSPLQISRTLQQFGAHAQKTGPNAPAGAEITFGRSGFLPVNTPVEDGQRMTIAGVEMQFHTRYGSDTDDCLTVYLPESGVVLNNHFWPFVPNIYTLRGAKFRDPREWRDGLKIIRDLKPEALVNTHARALRGRSEVDRALGNVIDGLSAILDQTLRGILHGLGPDDLRTFVKLPDHLAESPNLAEIYGEISHFGPYLFNHALGWFDGDAATINPLPPAEQALRLVDAMGGSNSVLAKARAAFAKREFSWAAELINYLYRLHPADSNVTLLKADILEQMGRITPAHTIRNWYLSQARALRGEVRIPWLQFANPRILAVAEPSETLDQYRVRIDPVKSAQMDVVMAITISDRKARHAWHLRQGVVEFLSDPTACGRKPDLEINSDYDSWLRFFTCRQPLPDFLQGVSVSVGRIDQVEAFFSAFDYFDAAHNSIVTSHAL